MQFGDEWAPLASVASQACSLTPPGVQRHPRGRTIRCEGSVVPRPRGPSRSPRATSSCSPCKPLAGLLWRAAGFSSYSLTVRYCRGHPARTLRSPGLDFLRAARSRGTAGRRHRRLNGPLTDTPASSAWDSSMPHVLTNTRCYQNFLKASLLIRWG